MRFKDLVIVLAILLPSVRTLEITDCKDVWEKTELSTYSYTVDCSNLGFTEVPDRIPDFTSQFDLSGNDIVYLEEGVFKSSPNLKKLDLSRNKLFCDWRIWWLVPFARKLDSFTGACFQPRALRGRDIRTLKQEDLAVDCLSVKKLTGATKDGDYEMRVFGHDNRIAEIFIYCYEMASDDPTEFLSLPSGADTNFVKIDKDACDYSEDLQTVLESTNTTSTFTYVKIDLRRLQLIANDSTLHPRSRVTYGKPTVCDSVMCTKGISSVDLRGTHFQLKETKSARQISKCTQQCGESCSHPNHLTLSILNPVKNPFAACTLPLGMQNSKIPDLELTASSHRSPYFPSHARINSMKHMGWCAETNDGNQEFVIHLGKKMTISGISTQGHRPSQSWVKSYEVFYSVDGFNYVNYEEVGVKKIFLGNNDNYNLVTHWFRPRIIARFVKIKPVSWHQNVCMRLEIYGCENDINSYIIQKIPEDRCLTVGERVYDKNGSPQYPLVQKRGCEGSDFMFTFHPRRLQHTKTGLCLHLTDQSWFIFNKTCSTGSLMFQKVVSKAEVSFLIKDYNGYCARIQETDPTSESKIFSIWRTCHRGGFTIFKLTREGVSAFKPVFPEKKTTVVTDLFKPLTLRCHARAEPIPLYEWSRNNTIPSGQTKIQDGVVVKSNHVTLTLRNVSWSDRGSYFCNAWNSKGYEFKEYEVIVNAIQKFITRPTDQKVIYGESAKFDCVSRGIPTPHVSWFTYDESIAVERNVLDINPRQFSVSENGSLVITNARYVDEKTYRCVSTSPRLVRNVTAKLDVYVEQAFLLKPIDQTVLYGSPVIFNCVSEGRPTPTISWQISLRGSEKVTIVGKDNVDTDEKYEILNNGSLRINAAFVKDEGVYTCLSTNPGLTRNTSASLVVYVTQEFTKVPQPKRVLYASNVTFECVSVGVPAPYVTWRKRAINSTTHSALIHSDLSKYTIFANRTLRINNVDYSDEGIYECVSESPRLIKTKAAELNIYVTQNFTSQPEDGKILYGHNHTLNCLSVGVPTPSVTWFYKPSSSNKENQTFIKITDLINPNIKLASNHQLNLTNANFDMIGRYICVSESPGLRRNISAFVSVHVTQQFTHKPQSQTVIEGDPIAIMTCISTGVPTPKTYWKFTSSSTGAERVLDSTSGGDSRLTVEENNDLVIRGVQNSDEGKYTCFSESPRLLVNVSATLTVHVPPIVSISAKNITVFSSQSAHVTCSAFGDPSPVIRWYQIKNGERSELSERATVEDGTLSLKKVIKEDRGEYACVATNAAGEVDVQLKVKVNVRCLMDEIPNGDLHPKKYVFGEKGKVRVTCRKGFKREGHQNLTCTGTGFFNHPFPKCEDIDECDTEAPTEDGSGVGMEMNMTSPSIDDEPDVCDYNARCVNTLGSYQCICAEGYIMVRNKCEFSPPGSKSKNPPPNEEKKTSTTPPPFNFDAFDRMIILYQKRILDEENFLIKLLNFTNGISALPHFTWRREALRRVVDRALNVTVSQVLVDAVPNSDARNLIKLNGLISNSLMDTRYQKEWNEINEKSCGTICLMKYLEEYSMKIASKMSKGFKENILFNFDALSMKISSVNETFKYTDFEMSMMKTRDEGNTVLLPKENYELLKDSASVSIQYKTLSELMPTPEIKEIDEGQILSDVFSLSFTKLHSKKNTTLKSPAQIIFKVPKDQEAHKEGVCVYWDFEKGQHGSWSTEGCEVANTTDTEVICQCNHLTNFAVIVPTPPLKMIHLQISLAVAVGVGLCIFLAFLACLSHVCCSPYADSDRKAILVNITLTIIFCLMIFTGAVFLSTMELVPAKYGQYFCYTLIGCLQLFGCAFFAWIFAEAIHLYLSTRLVIDKGDGRLALFYFIGWGIPIMIVAVTGVLVYFNKFDLQSRCVVNISLYLVGIIIGGPVLLYILGTLIVYILIRVSLASDRELLNAKILFHAKGAIYCSFCLMLLHLLVLGSATMFLKYNGEILYHYFFAALTAAEGLYLVFYHCYVDRRAHRTSSRSNSKKRNSYSTKETVTYSPNGTSSNTELAEEVSANDQKFLIKRPSKRTSTDSRPSPPQVRNLQQHSSEEALEWDSAYQGMYGGSIGFSNNTPHSSHETKPLLSRRTDTLTEEDGQLTPSTFHGGTISKNSTLSRNNTLPKRWKDLDEVDGSASYNHHKHPIRRSNSKASSILSVETHTSGANTQHGLPVYFPAPPPHYEMSLERRKKNTFGHESEPYDDDSRRGSFGMESDRMSNISSELSNILYELQAFDTNVPQDTHERKQPQASGNTLPSSRRDGPMTDISHSPMSTFRPTKNKDSNKSDIQYEENKPPSYTDHQRVRILRGKSRQETDPADGLHSPGSMYSSL
ncbi:uncharacterized protein [Clytia hemisphaerica]|uniref:uncharacterized protein isoform X2 n=1 Tax=Clytia hemisphaerica TaxID=252671 RepID=UPI0034D4B69A